MVPVSITIVRHPPVHFVGWENNQATIDKQSMMYSGGMFSRYNYCLCSININIRINDDVGSILNRVVRDIWLHVQSDLLNPCIF